MAPAPLITESSSVRRIVRLYRAGASSLQIAAEYGVDCRVVLGVLRRAGVRVRRRGRYKARMARAGAAAL